MGCWAINSFGNDDAADWIADLVDADDLAPVQAAISAVLTVENGYLEAPDASQALAAAEVVAAAVGNASASASSQEELIEWLGRVKPEPNEALVAQAARAIDRILAEESELRELWEDTDDYAEWQRDVESLRNRLGA